MNSRFVPDPATAIELPGAAAVAALVTASYAPDFERCRLLCESIDRFVSGVSRHYLLVEERDINLFRRLESARRVVVSERDLLPSWLKPYDDPLSLFRRRVWLAWRTQPLRGWHVQQLRRIAIAAHVAEPVLVYCDSDVAFLKPFDCSAFSRDGKVRLFRRDDVIAAEAESEQKTWSVNAGKALGIAAPAWSPHDYIATLISWRRESVLAMCRQIEHVHSRHWIKAIASERRFSECMLYGRFADEVEEGTRHFHGADEFCRVHWNGEPLSDDAFRAFVAAMTQDQVAIGMQSFIGTDLARIRRLIGG
jgi:hypothetical protein